MNPTHEDRLLGEYRLKELLKEDSVSRTWLAEQVSVSRRVLVDELKNGNTDLHECFIADVRAKAGVDHPLVGSVYEAVRSDESCFYAHEWLPGATLEDRRNAGAPFRPARLAHLLRRIAEVQMSFEAAGLATEPFGLGHVHLDEHGVLRIQNPVVAGDRDPARSVRDVRGLGESLGRLVADSQPGSSRMATLLGWMRGEQIEKPLTWEQVREVCEQIEQQLAEAQAPIVATQRGYRPQKKFPVATAIIIGVLAMMIIIVLSLQMRPSPVTAPKKSTLTDVIAVSGGVHPTPDGTEEDLHAFRISTQEVTIGQYEDFLTTLRTLAASGRERTFDHENQPAEKKSHEPDEWTALLEAVKTGASWKGLKITMDTPVVGVDWWDCAAYAEWKQARLPTQEEWFAACHQEVKNLVAIPPAGWIDVTRPTQDRTPAGLVGMAGSVCEWTRRPAVNPNNPLGERKWVIMGGSYLKPGSNALTREWVDDRMLRRADLGFRIVFEGS